MKMKNEKMKKCLFFFIVANLVSVELLALRCIVVDHFDFGGGGGSANWTFGFGFLRV